MKIDFGDGQSVERAEPADGFPDDCAVWLALRCDVDGAMHQIAVLPEVARMLLGALRQLDSAGLLEDQT